MSIALEAASGLFPTQFGGKKDKKHLRQVQEDEGNGWGKTHTRFGIQDKRAGKRVKVRKGKRGYLGSRLHRRIVALRFCRVYECMDRALRPL